MTVSSVTASNPLWPINCPAAEVLTDPRYQAIPWARFDAAWYRFRYAKAVPHLADVSDDALLRFHLSDGQRLGHAPNPFFDETWFRNAYRSVAAAIGKGELASGFDAYCRGRSQRTSPHWLFDERFYRTRYPDLGDDVLAANGLANGYDHFLRHGDRERRMGHMLFDPSLYLSGATAAEASAIREKGAFRHYLAALDQRAGERRTSWYFEASWYRDRYPQLSASISEGPWRSALEHFLCNPTATAFDPLPWFSEAWYLGRDPGLPRAIEAGDFRNGYAHFLRFGLTELRSPCAALDLRWYAGLPEVQAALDQGLADNAFTHWLRIGLRDTLPPRPPRDDSDEGRIGALLARRAARNRLPLAGRNLIAFETVADPALSAVMVLRDRFAATMTTLHSLRANFPGPVELILVDCGSTDETRSISRYVGGAQIIWLSAVVSAPAACNAAVSAARGKAVLFLGAGAELAPNAVAAALRRLDSETDVGAVCGMVVGADGMLRAAGGVVGEDGAVRPFGRHAPVHAPEANFTRTVEAGFGPFLLTSRDALAAAGGFDTGFANDGYATADLCVRLSGHGRRVVYDPAIMIHDAHASPGDARHEASDRARLKERHGEWFDRRQADRRLRPSPAHRADTGAHRILFIEDTVPLRSIGSGFVRANDLVRTMAAAGYAVTIFPMNGSRFDLASVYADMPDTVEVLHNRSRGALGPFLAEHWDHFDTLWVARTHNLDSVAPVLEPLLAERGTRPRLILDSEAIASVRQAGRHALSGGQFDLRAAMEHEFAHAALCDRIVAVSALEAAQFRDLGFAPVDVVGHMQQLRPTRRAFSDRSGLLFVGAIHEEGSPNHDGLCWFIDRVLPLIERALGWETRLTVTGYTAPGVSLDRFRDHPRVTLRGMLSDLGSLYDTHRVFVAPTRFGAGIPYKVFEAAAHGLPTVTSDLLARQLGWDRQRELVAVGTDDPAAMAERIVSLYRDAAAWEGLRNAALARLARDYSAASYTRTVCGILGSARVKAV